MGLNQYWFRKRTPEEKTEQLLQNQEVKDNIEIGYHRKWRELQEFLDQYYTVPDSNCEELEINYDILSDLENWATTLEGRHYSATDAWVLENTTLPLIRQLLDQGHQVVYWPWW